MHQYGEMLVDLMEVSHLTEAASQHLDHVLMRDLVEVLEVNHYIRMSAIEHTCREE